MSTVHVWMIVLQVSLGRLQIGKPEQQAAQSETVAPTRPARPLGESHCQFGGVRLLVVLDVRVSVLEDKLKETSARAYQLYSGLLGRCRYLLAESKGLQEERHHQLGHHRLRLSRTLRMPGKYSSNILEHKQ
jgi:hypothetical protein